MCVQVCAHVCVCVSVILRTTAVMKSSICRLEPGEVEWGWHGGCACVHYECACKGQSWFSLQCFSMSTNLKKCSCSCFLLQNSYLAAEGNGPLSLSANEYRQHHAQDAPPPLIPSYFFVLSHIPHAPPSPFPAIEIHFHLIL